jgi:kinesin family member 3B
LIASFQAIRNECVQVIVRCRPMSNKEKASNFQQVVDVYPNRGVIEIVNPSEPSKENKKTFTYDAVYNANGSQQMIYDEVVRPLVSSVLEGFNGCVFGEFKFMRKNICKTFTHYVSEIFDIDFNSRDFYHL